MVGEVLLGRERVRLAFHPQGQKGPQFTGEEKSSIHYAPQQGFHAETVTRQEQGVVLGIMDGQREETVEIVQECRSLQRV